MVGGFMRPKQNAACLGCLDSYNSVKNIVIPEVLLYLS